MNRASQIRLRLQKAYAEFIASLQRDLSPKLIELKLRITELKEKYK